LTEAVIIKIWYMKEKHTISAMEVKIEGIHKRYEEKINLVFAMNMAICFLLVFHITSSQEPCAIVIGVGGLLINAMSMLFFKYQNGSKQII
jgi:hypothetical protein